MYLCENGFQKSIREQFSLEGEGVDGGGDSEILLGKEEDNQHESACDSNGFIFLSLVFYFLLCEPWELARIRPDCGRLTESVLEYQSERARRP